MGRGIGRRTLGEQELRPSVGEEDRVAQQIFLKRQASLSAGQGLSFSQAGLGCLRYGAFAMLLSALSGDNNLGQAFAICKTM